MSDPTNLVPDPSESRPGLSRREAIGLGGLGLSLAAVLAACGGDSAAPAPATLPRSGEPPIPASLPTLTVDEAVLLRTSGSVSRAVAYGYDEILGLDVLDDEVAETFELFRTHHLAQADVMDEAVRDAGSEPSSEPNPRVVVDDIDPALALISEGGNQVDDVVRFALGLEQMAAATQQLFVPLVARPGYRRTLMEVGAAQTRQASVVAGFVEGATTVPPPPTVADEEPTKLPVAQVPSTFGKVSSVPVQIGDEVVTFTIPGPAAYVYEP